MFNRLFRLLAVSITTLLISGSATFGGSPTPEDWRTHVVADLLPFWESTAAIGSPVGNFPSQRCNDGTLPDATDLCAELAYSSVQPLDRQRLIALSRQVYTYAVAFHLTGNSELLDAAVAGSNRLFEYWVDPENGLFFEYMDPEGAAGPPVALRQSAKQAYGLLGPAMLYLVNRDDVLLRRIETVEARINTAFRNDTGTWYSVHPGRSKPAEKLADHLDHLNAYLYLMALTAPEPGRVDRLQAGLATARYLRDVYYDAETGLYRRHANVPEGTLAKAHFGYSAKTIWFTEMLAREADDMALAASMTSAAARLFPRAFDARTGGWHIGLDVNGTPLPDADWWTSAELSQLLSILAVSESGYRNMLGQVFRFWREHMVDAEYGDTWQAVDLRTLTPNSAAPKHWEWKAGFHAFEQAFVGYLSSAAIAEVPVSVYVSGQAAADAYRVPFGFSIDTVSSVSVETQAARGIFSLTLTGLSRPKLP